MSNLKPNPRHVHKPGRIAAKSVLRNKDTIASGKQRLIDEKARIEKAKEKVEARRKAGASTEHLNKLRYGADI